MKFFDFLLGNLSDIDKADIKDNIIVGINKDNKTAKMYVGVNGDKYAINSADGSYVDDNNCLILN